MFRRHLFGMLVLMAAADGGEPGGGAGGAPPPAPAAPPPAPHVDAEKVKLEARADVLKSLGFESEESFEADKKARKAAADAKLSESERASKALAESLDNHKKAETKLEAARAELAREREERAREKLFYAQGVRADAQSVARVLYDEAKAKDPKSDDAKVFAEMREKWPNVFGAASAPRANTSPGAPPPAANGISMLPAGSIDASKMSDEQWRQHKAAKGYS